MSLQLTTLHGKLNAFAQKISSEQSLVAAACARLAVLLGGQKDLRTRWAVLADAAVHEVAAEPIEEPSRIFSLPPRPQTLSLFASDGSQIFPDRNLNADFFLLNISRICFHIGVAEKPCMESYADLYDAESLSELGFAADGDEHSEITFETITALRQDEELRILLEIARHHRVALRPALALADGTLICWHLKKLKNIAARKTFIGRYVQTLAGFRHASIPIASYVSFPGGRDAMGTLAIVLAEELASAQLSIDALDDRVFFQSYLRRGERSAVFASRSDALGDYAESDRVYFFYLHTGSEIARIEFPRWCFDSGLVDLIHAAFYDDAEKGGGYPMTLTEAHERAVVKPSEQQQFYQLLERLCAQHGFRFAYSAKSLSKRTAKI